jgi:hypothetical protein
MLVCGNNSYHENKKRTIDWLRDRRFISTYPQLRRPWTGLKNILTRLIGVPDGLRLKSLLKHFWGKMALFGNGFAGSSGVAEFVGNRLYESAGKN